MDHFHGSYQAFAYAYNDLINVIKRHGQHVGPRNQKTSEILDCGFTIPATDQGCFTSHQHETHLPYLAGEILYYLQGRNDVEGIARHSKFWEKIQNKDGTVNSAYGYLLFTLEDSKDGSQWQSCLHRFAEDPFTRQAVMLLHRPEHHWAGNKDLPCTMYMHPFVRKTPSGCLELNMQVRMRSSDLWFGLPFDVPFFLLVQENLRRHLNKMQGPINPTVIHPGSFTLTADSMHIYHRNMDKFSRPYRPIKPLPMIHPNHGVFFSWDIADLGPIIHPDLVDWLGRTQKQQEVTA